MSVYGALSFFLFYAIPLAIYDTVVFDGSISSLLLVVLFGGSLGAIWIIINCSIANWLLKGGKR